jgi:putative membrane protein
MTSEPAVDERRLHPAATVINAIHHVRSVGFAALAVIASQGLTRGLAIVGALAVIASVWAFVSWRTTRYAVIDGALRLRTGLLSRKEQNIPASRISALDTTRGLLQRIFGVVAVQVQTAGGNKQAELVLRAVSVHEAERLRRELGHRSATAPEQTAVLDAATPAVSESVDARVSPPLTKPQFTSPSVIRDDAPVVYSMTPRELLVAALTSPSIAVVGAAVAGLYSIASDALPDHVQRQIAGEVHDLTIGRALVLVAIAVVIATVVSVVGTLLLYAGFTVTRDEKRLRVRRGLISELVGTIPVDRIHGVRVVEAPLRQLLGYASIEVEVAGYAGQSEVTRTLVPLVRTAEIPGLLAEIVPTLEWPAGVEPVPARARRRYVTPLLMVSLVPAAALLVAPIGTFRGLAVIFPVAAIVLGLLAARDAGWHLAGDTLTLRWRTVSRSTLLAQSSRLQRVEEWRSPFQRPADLATFRVRLSNARRARLRHLDAETVETLLRRAGR